MTTPYLLLVRSSSSSIGGLVMPSGGGATPDTGGRAPQSQTAASGAGRVSAAPSLVGAAPPAEVGRGRSQQGYQLVGRPGHVVVDDDGIELPRGVQLGLGDGQPALLHLRRLRAAAGQPADQSRPGRRSEEDELRMGV